MGRGHKILLIASAPIRTNAALPVEQTWAARLRVVAWSHGVQDDPAAFLQDEDAPHNNRVGLG